MRYQLRCCTEPKALKPKKTKHSAGRCNKVVVASQFHSLRKSKTTTKNARKWVSSNHCAWANDSRKWAIIYRIGLFLIEQTQS